MKKLTVEQLICKVVFENPTCSREQKVKILYEKYKIEKPDKEIFDLAEVRMIQIKQKTKDICKKLEALYEDGETKVHFVEKAIGCGISDSQMSTINRMYSKMNTVYIFFKKYL